MIIDVPLCPNYEDNCPAYEFINSRTHNSSFGKNGKKRLRLKIFRKLELSSSVES